MFLVHKAYFPNGTSFPDGIALSKARGADQYVNLALNDDSNPLTGVYVKEIIEEPNANPNSYLSCENPSPDVKGSPV